MSLNNLIVLTSIIFCNLIFASPIQFEDQHENATIDLHSPRSVSTRPYPHLNLASTRSLGGSKSSSAEIPQANSETRKTAKKIGIVPSLNLRSPMKELQISPRNTPGQRPELGKKETKVNMLLAMGRVLKSPREKANLKQEGIRQESLRSLKQQVKSDRPTTLERGEQQRKILCLIRQALKNPDQSKAAELADKLATEYACYKEMLEQQKAGGAQQKPFVSDEQRKALAELQREKFADAERELSLWLTALKG